MWNQRSADLFLGVPFNIASYAALTYILAKMCNLKLGEFVHVIGDAHVYKDHVEPLKEQLKRKPYDFPSLSITKELNTIQDLDTLTFQDFKLKNYEHHKTVKMKMST